MIAGVWIAAVVATLVAGGEIVVRVLLGDRVEQAAQRLGLPEGMQVSLADGLVLPSLATGRVPLDVTVAGANVAALAQCLPAAGDTELSLEDGVIVARKVVTVRDVDVPVTVTLSPVISSGRLRLDAGDVSVAGLSLPPAAVNRIVSGLPTGQLLVGGAELQNLLPRDVTVRDVEVNDSSMLLSLDVPVSLARDSSAGSSRLTDRATGCA